MSPVGDMKPETLNSEFIRRSFELFPFPGNFVEHEMANNVP